MEGYRVGDNRVCMFYMVERIDECLNKYDPKQDRNAEFMLLLLDELRTELVYNLGINTLNNHKEEMN
jgi:hypothetical protein